MNVATHADPHISSEIATLRSRWGWFVALGVALLVLGFIAFANLLSATVASVLVVGTMMLIGGILQIIQAFPFQSWGSFAYWLLSGLLYTAAGLLAYYNPELAASALTLLLAILLLATGVMRIVAGVRSRTERGWGWIVASGVLTALAGLIIATGWPVNALWVLGLFLAIDLIFNGVAVTAFGIGLRSSSVDQRRASAA